MDTNRHSRFDRLIVEALKLGQSSPQHGGCLTTEAVAAWADSSLTGRERRAAEAHAAECARCQALLAAMTRASVPQSVAPRWVAARIIGWWVLPVAAAAAAVVWLIGPDRRGDGQRAPAAAVDRLVWPNPSIPQPLEQRIAPESTPELKIAALSSAQANTPPTRPAAAAQDRPAASGISSNQAGPAEPVRPPPAERATESLASGRGGTTGNALLSAPAAEKSEPRSSPEAAVLKRPTMPQITAASAFAAMFDTTALRAVVIRSADPAVRWRITGAGVQRSTDGGSTWQSQDAGSAAVQLVAGVSPSPTVCWMVGRGGTVLLSIDGSSWRQLAFPEAVDLTSVAATSAGAATVTTSDGRVFGTTDGGATWTAK